MKTTRSKRADVPVPPRRASMLSQAKSVHSSNPVEMTHVKLQRLPGAFASTMWSTDGIARASRLQRSNSTPPMQEPAVQHGSKGFVVARDGAQTGLQLSCNVADATTSKLDAHDNQADNNAGVTPALIGMDIQRSWSAPPIAEQTRALDDNQSETQSLSSLSLDKLKTRALLPDLLAEAHNDRESNSDSLWKKPSVHGLHALAFVSPDRSDTHVVSEYDSSFSNQDSNASSAACSESSSHAGSPPNHRAPPGLSRLSSLHTGSFSHGNDFGHIAPSNSNISNSNAVFLTDALEGMAHLRIGSQAHQQYRHDAAVVPAAFGYAFNDLHRSRPLDAAYIGSNSSNGFLSGRTAPGCSGNPPVFTHAPPFSSPSPYLVHPHSSLPSMAFRGNLSTTNQLKQPWTLHDGAYNRNDVSSMGFAGGRRVGSEYQFKPVGIYGAMKQSEPPMHNRNAYAPHMFAARESYPHNNAIRMNAPPQYCAKVNDSRRSEFAYVHPAAHSYSSSSLLEEFASASKADKWELSTIKGHLVLFARDQSGSRFIQQQLERAADDVKADAFNEILPHALALMTDVFGNYVIQKFFEHGSVAQQQRLVDQMRTNVLALALQVYGCRVLQRALEVTQVSEQLVVIHELHGHVQQCIQDQNGNHVLQKCIEAASWRRSGGVAANTTLLGSSQQRRLTGDDVQFIIDDVIGCVAEYSMHSYGCRVIQRILEHCSPMQIRPIVNEIVSQCRELMKDQFGNYVVQHVIGHGEPDQRRIVMDAVLPDIARWSQHKFASNVVEACLERATKAEVARTVDFILQCDETGASCPLLPMMKHMYGNYVVQKLLDKADPSDRARIVCIIRHNADYLRRFTFGKHVLSRLEREGAGNTYY